MGLPAMLKNKIFVAFLCAGVLLATLAFPVSAQVYTPGVTTGQYVMYGNFIEVGESGPYHNYDWSRLDVVAVSGNDVSLLVTGQMTTGDPIPSNGTVGDWNLENGTYNGGSVTQGGFPIIAANLTADEPIPSTDWIINTETDIFLGVARSTNIVTVLSSTADYNSSETYYYDQLSGMLMAWQETIFTFSDSSTVTWSYNIIATNIFGSVAAPSPSPSAVPTITTQPSTSPTQTPPATEQVTAPPTQTPTATEPTSSPSQTNQPAINYKVPLEYLIAAVAIIVALTIALIISLTFVMKKKKKQSAATD
jgi:hypothetical protein